MKVKFLLSPSGRTLTSLQLIKYSLFALIYSLMGEHELEIVLQVIVLLTVILLLILYLLCESLFGLNIGIISLVPLSNSIERPDIPRNWTVKFSS